MTRKLTVLAVAAAVAAAVAVPVHLLADVSSCSLASSSYADAVLNPPKGEDTEFFVSSGGVPNVMFLIDTSGSMMAMAPDGAEETWGSFGNTFGCTNAFANSRVYASPCGTTTLDGSPYNPKPGFANPNDYYEAKDAKNRYCPYMVSGNQPAATDKPGFDPDFPDFFPKDRVFRDGSGWDIGGPNPSSSGGTQYTVATFCSTRGTQAQRDSCAACMRDQGYWFTGSLGSESRDCATTQDCSDHRAGMCIGSNGLEYNVPGVKSGKCRVPTVYFSGNFLNFFPPKFLMARKVLKDVLLAVRRVRLGITTFGSGSGRLLDPLNPGCNQFGTPSSFDSNRSALKAEINNTTKVAFNTWTPLAETLLKVGQYYHSADLPWFTGTSYKDSGFVEGSGVNRSVCFSCQASAVLVITDGLPNGDGDIPGTDFAPKGMDAATAAKTGSYAGMAGYNIRGIPTSDCPECETWAELADTALTSCSGNQDSGACNDSGTPIISYLPRVAWYLKNTDLRLDTDVGADGFPFTGHQGLTTYTIGLGTRGAASEILRHTANMGGGLFNGGTGRDVVDVKSLKDAIMRVLEDVNTRSTSFGSASVSTLQVESTQGVLIPRFEPSRAAHWDGHLYAFDLYSEATSGETAVSGKVPCVVGTTRGPLDGDYDCDRKCGSVFLMDKDSAFIQEDGSGAFKKNFPADRAACGYNSLCGLDACAVATTTAARPWWDAGERLSPVKKDASGTETKKTAAEFPLGWKNRKIFTVIDRNGDRRLDAADMPLVDLRTADPADLAPYLNIRGGKYCANLSQRLSSLGNPAGATIDAELSSSTLTTCAKMLLNYVRGADIFNERKNDKADSTCGSNYPSATKTGDYCTRRYQLGDVFHSSPQEVRPPGSSSPFGRCARGEDDQCLPSLWSDSVVQPSLDGYEYAYDDFWRNDRYHDRARFALVGANDGMLHAFRAERYTLSATEDPNVGDEIWAFIPPDLLPKLRLLTESTHHFFVDGTPMVRNVWIDGGTLNKLRGGGSRAADGIRQGDEFHTVTVVGERRGGTHFFALDITEAAPNLDAEPRFLWVYPQPNDPEQLQFGETYAEFAPKAPPIGPVRIDAGPAPCSNSRKAYNVGGESRCVEERYIVLLNGGFDPHYTRGRGVHMVDVATGEEIWDFSQPAGTGTGCNESSDPRCHLNYPVAAPVGMMAWGDSESFDASQTTAPFFDTATFGDTGGQLWVLRFSDPGKGWEPGKGTKVTNWFGARMFQGGLSASTPACGLDYCGGQPYFYITSNIKLNANNQFYVLNGTGDRFNLLDPVGGTCGPENLRACLLKGCTVTLKDASGNPGALFGVEPLLGTQSYAMNNPPLCAATPVGEFSYAATGSGGATCTTIVQQVDGLTISCPSTLTCSKANEVVTKKASVACTADSCDAAAANDFGGPIDVKGNPDKVNLFTSMQVFEKSGARKIFRDLPGAIAYDKARLGESSLFDVTPVTSRSTSAALSDPLKHKGWRYTFSNGDTGPTTVTVNGLDHYIYRTDERAASVSTVSNGCSYWNTMQPALPTGSIDPDTACPVNSPCKAGRAQLSYFYRARAGTGDLCRTSDGVALARFSRNDSLVPPHMGRAVTYMTKTQVSTGLTSVRVPQGGANEETRPPEDLVNQYQWLPIDRRTHKCRHGTSAPNPEDCR